MFTTGVLETVGTAVLDYQLVVGGLGYYGCDRQVGLFYYVPVLVDHRGWAVHRLHCLRAVGSHSHQIGC